MTEPRPQRPVPGPPRPGPWPLQQTPPRDPDGTQARVADHDGAATPAPTTDAEAFGALDRRPVAEHVAIFEAEHARLRDELSTIDQL